MPQELLFCSCCIAKLFTFATCTEYDGLVALRSGYLSILETRTRSRDKFRSSHVLCILCERGYFRFGASSGAAVVLREGTGPDPGAAGAAGGGLRASAGTGAGEGEGEGAGAGADVDVDADADVDVDADADAASARAGRLTSYLFAFRLTSPRLDLSANRAYPPILLVEAVSAESIFR